jgi:HAD superfamily hydrolase (TIGR01509 family)
MYEAFGLPRPVWAQADERWVFHYHGEEPQLLPGAADVVETLQRGGLRLGIVTGANRKRLEGELSRLGLDGIFASVICHEDVICKKPHPEGIERSLERLRAKPQNCCFVGDAPDDIRMGRSAGVCTVAVRSEYVDLARLEECGANHLLRAIAELPAILAEVG